MRFGGLGDLRDDRAELQQFLGELALGRRRDADRAGQSGLVDLGPAEDGPDSGRRVLQVGAVFPSKEIIRSQLKM